MRGDWKVKEAHVQRAVLDLLAAKHIFAIRMNTVAMRNAKGRPVYAHSAGAGLADILAFPRLSIAAAGGLVEVKGVPCPLWIEVKSSSGRQTPEQKNFEAKVLEERHQYLVVRSPEDLLAWLNEHGL